jgi:polysaccharide chain length determinant protein (PEP-CTERM system associated)
MGNLSYYFSIFRRRFAYFLIVATILSAIAVTVAYTLPPAYVSKMVILVESPQIPEELASSTVRTPAFEQLQIVQQRLLTRANLLDISRRLDVLPNMDKLNPDEIVGAMRARTKIKTSNRRLKEAPLMTVSFEAPQARTAAGVLNEYLILIQQQDNEYRKGRSGETLEFFKQEVARLSDELDTQSARILEFKQASMGALPESLKFRLNQQSELQDRLGQAGRNISDLKNQRDRLMQLFEITGQVDTPTEMPLSPEEQQLQDLRRQLDEALVIYSAANPRVKLLEGRISQLETRLDALKVPSSEEGAADSETAKPLPAMLTIQLSDIDNRIVVLEDHKISLQAQIDALNDSIAKTPEVSIALEELNRKYNSIELQYNQAEIRLSQAQTGDRIETRSRGQRMSVIEQPAIPDQPTKPNRILIAGGGVAFGIFAGFGLIFLLEMLNTTARRPEDIIKRLGVTPLTTIPYTRTRAQRFRQRSGKLLLILVILVGIPAAVYAVHLYYLPLDLIADKVMNKMGVRW